MDELIAVILAIFAALIGAVTGYVLRRLGEKKEPDAGMSQLATQVAEMRGKFEEMEKGRAALEAERLKGAEERERRWQEFVKGVQESVAGVTTQVGQFQKLMLGTKQRGEGGEAILKEFLKEPIKTGFIKTNVNTGNGVVEFAVDLGGGKFLPIDSKLPDVYALLDKMEKSKDADEQKTIKREIKKKMETAVGQVVKYLNQPKTIGKCVLAVPDALIDMYPEMVGEARESNVYLTGHSFAYLVSYLLYEEHQRMIAEGDLGKYKKDVEKLQGILGNILEKAETLEKGLKMAGKARDEICDEARKG